MSAMQIAPGARLRRGVLTVVAGLTLVAALAAGGPARASMAAAANAAAAARATASGGTWGKAEEIPGIAALAEDGSSYALSVSCGAPGNCSAGGNYSTFVNEPGPIGAFVVSEQGGTWGTAEQVAGPLNQGGNASLNSVSCASAGNCSAGGRYLDSSGDGQAFVVGETNGTWGTAKEEPGIVALNKGGSALIDSVSCASAGNCSVGGGYAGSPNGSSGELFVVGEMNGTQGTAKEVPGFSALNKGGSANMAQVSCASVGHCSAIGFYTTHPGNGGFNEAFVVDET